MPSPSRSLSPSRFGQPNRFVRPGRFLHPGRPAESGQTTAEYALVLLGAAAIALLLVAWATRTDAIGRLFDAVVSRILDQVG